MKIVALSDIHGRLAHIEKVAPELAAADLVLLAGDLTNFGGVPDAARVVDAVRALNAKVFAVIGNCDHPDCDAYLEETGAAIHCRPQFVNGVVFAGLSGSLPCPLHTLNEKSEEELRASLDMLSKAFDPVLPWVFVSHQPPFDTVVDYTHTGEHVGSAAVREFIERMQPMACFTGHIHEGRGIDHIGRTEIINPGSFAAGGYAVVELDGEVKDIKLCTV